MSCDCKPTNVNGEEIHDLTCSLFDGLPLNKTLLQIGDKVRFREVLDDGDELDRMEVLEVRGERVLVRSLVFTLDGAIQPTSVFDKDDLEVIQ